MLGSETSPLPEDLALDDSLRSAIGSIREDALAVMLYGSRARGTARADSDIDILALVHQRPGSETIAAVSINYYTVDDLKLLARRGSLFVLHLKVEGIVLSDAHGYLREALAEFTDRTDYRQLSGDLTTILNALSATDRDTYSAGLRRSGIWAARSAVYLTCAERGQATFDMFKAADTAGVPELAPMVRDDRADLTSIGRLGLKALGLHPNESSFDLATHAVMAWTDHPIAAQLLQSIISGQSQLDYTDLTLPIV